METITFDKLKTIMTNNVTDIILKTSIIGVIDCCEGMGKTIDETMDELVKSLVK